MYRCYIVVTFGKLKAQFFTTCSIALGTFLAILETFELVETKLLSITVVVLVVLSTHSECWILVRGSNVHNDVVCTQAVVLTIAILLMLFWLFFGVAFLPCFFFIFVLGFATSHKLLFPKIVILFSCY